MYAVKETNLLANGNPVHFIPAKDYADACWILRDERETMMNFSWEEGADYTIEVAEVEDDFDFESQTDWN